LQGSDLTPDKILQEQMNDSEIAPVIELMKRSSDQPSFDMKYLSSEAQQLCYQWDSLKLHDGILYREFINPDCSIFCYQLIVPRSLRTAVITQLYAGVGSLHQSLPKCIETVKRFAWWKTMRPDTERYVNVTCVVAVGNGRMPNRDLCRTGLQVVHFSELTSISVENFLCREMAINTVSLTVIILASI
jgi:hypothetical protein